MSLRKLVFVLMLVLPLGLCKAQTAPTKPVEPTAIGIVYRIDPATQELKKLPDEQWKKAGGPYGMNDVVVSGNQSSFRIRAGEVTEFVFKTGSPEKVSLYRFEPSQISDSSRPKATTGADSKADCTPSKAFP